MTAKFKAKQQKIYTNNWENDKRAGRYMNGFKKMARLSQSDKCRFCKVETKHESEQDVKKNSCQNSCTHKGTTEFVK